MELNEPSAKYLVQAGYKPTDIGLFPNDWNICALQDVTDPKRPISYGIVQTGPQVHGGVRCLRVVDISDGRVREEDLISTSPSISNTYKRTILQNNDLVMPLRGKVGDVGLIDRRLQGCNLTRGVALIAIRPPNSPAYCKHFLSFYDTRNRLSQMMNGSALQEIAIAPLRLFKIALPSNESEQISIEKTLTDADVLIESLEQLLAKKRQIKQGAMQELLTGQRRLPGFSDGWTPAKLEDLADIRSGGTPSTQKAEFWDGDILWCTPTDITALNGSKYLTDTHRKITAMGMKACSADLIPANSIVMTSRATIGECAINLAPLCTNQGFKNFVPFPHVDVQFLYYMLTTQKAGFISLCGGSTFLEIGKTQLRPYEVSMPPTKDEQTAIATILSDMDTEITALESRLTKARQLKQGMAQALLTGRIRLV